MNAQRGSALIETLLLGLLLIAPLIWALTVLVEIHNASLAGAAAARAAGADGARADDIAAAEANVRSAVDDAFIAQGLNPSRARVDWSSDPRFPRGGVFEVEVAYPVRILQAPLLGSVAQPVLWVRARHAARIDPYRSR